MPITAEAPRWQATVLHTGTVAVHTTLDDAAFVAYLRRPAGEHVVTVMLDNETIESTNPRTWRGARLLAERVAASLAAAPTVRITDVRPGQTILAAGLPGLVTVAATLDPDDDSAGIVAHDGRRYWLDKHTTVRVVADRQTTNQVTQPRTAAVEPAHH